MPHSFSKKDHHHHHFKKKKKKIKISKNHASISKLGTFGHVSSNFEKKEIIFSSNIKVFKGHASIHKLGEFHASFIKKNNKNKNKNQDFQKSCIHF